MRKTKQNFPIQPNKNQTHKQTHEILIRLKALDKHGITPILAAIWEGHTACVQLLLDKGATKSGSAPDGTSYVDAAEKPEIKKLLA